MTDKAGLSNRPARHRAVLAVLAAVVAAVPLCAAPAQAQFFWNRNSRFSADDAARVAIEHGFHVLARPVRNDDIYLVEVIDRRGARERLIITADSGEIVRRLFVQAGPRYRRDDESGFGPRRAPDDDHRPGFFARLFGGDDTSDDEARPDRPDRDVGDPDEAPRQPRVHRYPRIVEQSRESLREAPIESAPLAPPSAAPSIAPRPPRVRPPVQASLPPAPAVIPPRPPVAPAPVSPPASADHPVRSISSNPLAIPGSREQDEKGGGKAAQQTAPVKAPEPPKPGPRPVTPKDPVAVAPLD